MPCAAAWADMVGLIADRYDTTMEHANLIVGTIGDAPPRLLRRRHEPPRPTDRERLRHLPDSGN